MRGRTTTNVRHLSVEEASYIAGFLEADGSVGCKHSTYRSGYHRVAIGITQQDPEILYWIEATVGAGHITKNYGLSGGGVPRAYRWRITSRIDGVPFLEQIIPYMHTRKKKRRAELITLGECPRQEDPEKA